MGTAMAVPIFHVAEAAEVVSWQTRDCRINKEREVS